MYMYMCTHVYVCVCMHEYMLEDVQICVHT